MFDYVWLIPFLPLVGVLVNGLLGRRIEKANKSIIHWIGCGSVGLAFLVTFIIFIQMLRLEPDKRLYDYTWFTWMESGNFIVTVGYLIDPISMFMCMFVTGVGFLIHIYSIGYMWHDEGTYFRYFTYLNLFMFCMINLVLADNFLLMFLGWEGVGLCSYLLIAFWFGNKEFAIAGKKAFITNRIGDFFFAIGMLLLPDAMAGPTPVSALIHAATMVTAGVYFVARCNILYTMSPLAMQAVAIVGALTAFFAATIALTHNDIKKVLAYSTVSQLGYMFMGLGVGAFAAGLFHVLTHSFFKALLFMCAGCVIHGMSGEQDMRYMGGLRKKMPVTFYTMVIATLALIGFPGFSGFFSKDEILWMAFSSPNGNFMLWLIGVLTAAMTAFYMFRLIFMTFFNECRASEEVRKHIHEAPKSMTIPLIILAFLSVVGGYIGIPKALGGSNLVEHYLKPVIGLGKGKIFQDATGTAITHGAEAAGHHFSHMIEYTLMAITTIIVFAGIFLAYTMYMKKRTIPEKLAEKHSLFYRLLLNKWYIDELYEWNVIKPLHTFSVFMWKIADVIIIDGLVNKTAQFFMWCGSMLRHIQTGYVQRYAITLVAGTVVIVMYYIFSLYI
jgi:NADH-quinone oxidoreductase subunit L